MRNHFPDVLVVGAGPVGLTMAAELARHGASCRIIDRLAEPLSYCRAIGVTPRTLEVWDDMGVVRPLIDAGLWLAGTRSYLNQSAAQDTLLEPFELPYGHLGIPQPETERILTEHLAGFGVTVERCVALTSLKQETRGAEVELLHSDRLNEMAAFRFVVGCDGAHSAVRRLLKIPFEGDRFPFDFMLGDVMLDVKLPKGFMLRSIRPVAGGAPDFFVAIPLPDRNRFRVSMLAPEGLASASEPDHGLQSERPGPSIEELQVVADRLLPSKVVLSDLRWSSRFRISMRLAASYRKGDCFIAGDAAHIHPPTGGQGMNTGIQDAYNLAWKMALVLRGAAGLELLDSYEAERRPVGAEVVSRTRSQSEQFGRKHSASEERRAETQVLINYRASGLSQEAVGESFEALVVHAGDRAPDCYGLRRENLLYPVRLFDLTRGVEHVLLTYVGKTAEPRYIALLESLTQKLKVLRCRLYVVCSPEADIFDVFGATILTDSRGEFALAYAPGVDTGYLIRPDGHVGYHGRPMTESGVFGYLTALSGMANQDRE